MGRSVQIWVVNCHGILVERHFNNSNEMPKFESNPKFKLPRGSIRRDGQHRRPLLPAGVGQGEKKEHG
jgi:hypothetical protein